MTPYRERREQGYYDAAQLGKKAAKASTNFKGAATMSTKPATAKRTTKRTSTKTK